MSNMVVWCSTGVSTPRKYANPESSTDPTITVTLGKDAESRIVNASWRSNGIDADVSISVGMLKAMLAAAESYKPGATLSNPNPTRGSAAGV